MIYNNIHPDLGSRAVGMLGPVVGGWVRSRLGTGFRSAPGALPGTCSCHVGRQVCKVANTTQAQSKPPVGRGLCFVHLYSIGKSKSHDRRQRQWVRKCIPSSVQPWQGEEEGIVNK